MPRNRDLRYGPYAPPAVEVGDIIRCAMRGRVRVHRWSDRGAIQWPLVIRAGQSPGRPALAVTGDLVRAVQREAAIAVARHWRTTWRLVRLWRRALGVDRVTEGTRALLAEGGNPEISRYAPEANRASRQPDVRRKRDRTHAATLRAKPNIRQLMRRMALKRQCCRCHRYWRVVRPSTQAVGRTRKPRVCPRCLAGWIAQQGL